MDTNRFFVSENGYYEVATDDYYPNRDVTDAEWQKFADRLGEEFIKFKDEQDIAIYADLWNDAHNRVCEEFKEIFG
jgi:hypothetical protein